MVSHGAFLNQVNGLLHIGSMRHHDIVLQTTAVTFDVHLQDCLAPLMVGGTTVLLREGGNLDLDYVSTTCATHGITLITTVPSFLRAIYDYCESSGGSGGSTGWSRFRALSRIYSGGEALKPLLVSQLSERLGSGVTIYNMYGPAESTINTTYHACIPSDWSGAASTIAIGVPFPNYQCYVLDGYGAIVPIGSVGELYVSGASLFSGYLKRDDLTAAALLAPFPALLSSGITVPGDRLYRTGDLARYASDGQLVFCGRADFQVKLRGQRIEIGEIESTILSHGEVDNTVVIKREDGGQQYLCAYVTPRTGSTVTDTELRTSLLSHCQRTLASFMVPSVWMVLPVLPLNANGKY